MINSISSASPSSASLWRSGDKTQGSLSTYAKDVLQKRGFKGVVKQAQILMKKPVDEHVLKVSDHVIIPKPPQDDKPASRTGRVVFEVIET